MHISSSFNINGFDIGKGDRNLSYLYGLSDFWHAFFQDTEKVDILLEASAIKLSDIYSKFLQLTTTISLDTIQTATKQQIKLVLIKDSDLVADGVNKYTLSEPILDSRLIANRPFLPTTYLEQNIDFRISDDGTEITFAKPLNSLGFTSRKTSDGSREYGLWFIDVIVDEEYLYDFFGKFVSVQPQTSTDNYRNFIYGLYYLYAHGPNLDLLRKGLNLAIGIPLARDDETVLEIRKHLGTDLYIVITDVNSYLIPYGLEPSVVVGDVLAPTDELARWVEVKDYKDNGDWWINLQIPPAIIPYIPSGETDRYASEGSYVDYLMRNFLKEHLFLVNVKTISFKNLQNFEELAEIIDTVKPAYTQPIYVWTLPTAQETITINDDNFSLRWDDIRSENLSLPINLMTRENRIYSEFKTDNHAEITVSGNLLSYTGSGTNRSARASVGVSEEDWFWEVTIEESDAENVGVSIGVGTNAAALTGSVGSDANGWAYATVSYSSGGKKRTNGSLTSYGDAFHQGDVIGVHLARSTGVLTFYKNGVSQGQAYTGLTGTLYPMVSIAETTSKLRINFGNQVFSYTIPTDANEGMFTRDTQLSRGIPTFNRRSVSDWTNTLLGYSDQINGVARTYSNSAGYVDGFVNFISQFRANTYREKAWLRVFLSGAQDTYRVPDSFVNFGTGLSYYDNSGIGVRTFLQVDTSKRIVPLYTTRQDDIEAKYTAISETAPGLNTWNWTLTPADLTTIFSTFFTRGSSVEHLGINMPKISYDSYSPAVTDIQSGDYLLFVRIYESVVGVYWVTSNDTLRVPAVTSVSMTDPVSLTFSSHPITRGEGFYSTWYYLRGAGQTLQYGPGDAINAIGINAEMNFEQAATVVVTYSDQYNTTPVTMDRSGVSLNLRRDLK